MQIRKVIRRRFRRQERLSEQESLGAGLSKDAAIAYAVEWLELPEPSQAKRTEIHNRCREDRDA